MIRRRLGGRTAALFASLAAVMTLGHLIGPYGHAHPTGHEHAAVTETQDADCRPLSIGDDDGHADTGCGPVLTGTGVSAEPDAEGIDTPIGADDTGKTPVADLLGPNGRAPPERAQLQVVRV
jgi:hypothetical protein